VSASLGVLDALRSFAASASTASGSHSPTLGLALLVAAAGAVGAVLRALVIHHVTRRHPDPLPIGTMLVNASGSLLLGFLTGLALYHGFGPHDLDVAGVGLCGGYTTWSTASWESIHLIRDGHRTESVVYTFGGLALCLATAAAGIGIAALV
jgi:fluoride exporter